MPSHRPTAFTSIFNARMRIPSRNKSVHLSPTSNKQKVHLASEILAGRENLPARSYELLGLIAGDRTRFVSSARPWETEPEITRGIALPVSDGQGSS